jgi:preprotein translocase subunit SecF
MKQTIIILIVCVVAVAKGFSANFDYKSVTSHSAQSKQLTSDLIQIAYTPLHTNYRSEGNHDTNNGAKEIFNKVSEESNSSNSNESEQARSEMIAGAMGIGIF